jgi:serine phosphatase RsbU (regulator of sigma subunit)
MPLGLFQHVELEEDTVELQRGAALLLHTDGVNDARDPSGEFFGERRIRELLSSLAGRSALEVAERFGEALMAFQHDVAQDDTALLVVRVRR